MDQYQVVDQREVSRELGLRWSVARRVLELHGVRVLSDGPRRWIVTAEDWRRFRSSLPLAEAKAVTA